MNRKVKVVEINGVRGILTVIYAVICLLAGFIFFPAWGLMMLWNSIAANIYNLPYMNLIHGFMLYTVVILVYIATNTDKSGLFISAKNITGRDIASLMKDIDDEK